jgi:PAS domain S-box-containing protein
MASDRRPHLALLEADFEHLIKAMSSLDPAESTGEAGTVVRLRHADKAARESERRFRSLLEALPAAVYTTDAEGRITFYNPAAAELWGHEPTLGESEWCGSWRLYWPDGTPLPHDQCPMALALKEQRAIRGMEAVAERPDGRRVPFIPYPTPIFDHAGTLIGAVNMLVDITERKQAEEQKNLLIRELHHRVKNTLATVQALMNSTLRASASLEEFRDAFTGRVVALSKTHTLLLDDHLQAVSFRELLCNELEPFDDGTCRRVILNGPAVRLPSDLAVSVGMAIHELTTNAVKYGALSALGGSVTVTWEVVEGRVLKFAWIERNGPPVTPPTRQGFGSQLLQRVLASQVQAEVTIDYAPDGLRVEASLPLTLR